MASFHEKPEVSFAQNGIGDVESGKLYLPRMVYAQLLAKPVVERPVIFITEIAEGMGYPFDGIGLAVSEVVGWIDAPCVAGSVMRCLSDTVHYRITHVDIGRGHVDFSS